MSEELRRTIIDLRDEGVTTPEICQQLGIDADTVIALLVQGAIVPTVVVDVPKRPVGRPRKQVDKDLFLRIIKVIEPGDSEVPALWTFPQLLQVLDDSGQPSISGDTLRRYLHEQGLTFSTQLRQVIGSSNIPDFLVATIRSRPSILYVVTHLIARPTDSNTCQATTLIIGVTSSNRLTFYAQQQSRLSQGMLSRFLRGLLTLHSERHVVVILKNEGVYRSVAHDRSLHRAPRLHVYTLMAKKV